MDGHELSAVGRSAIVDGGSRETWRYVTAEAREASPLVVDLAHRIGRGPVTDDPVAITDYVDELRAEARGGLTRAAASQPRPHRPGSTSS